jgi:hypothetical protein
MAARRLAVLFALAALLVGAVSAAAAGPRTAISFDPSEVDISPEGSFSKVTIAGTRDMQTVGAPALPVEYISFVIPADARVEDVVFSLTGEFVLPGSHRVLPAQPEVPTGEIPVWVDPDASIYESDAAFPQSRVVYLGDGYLGGYHIASVAVYPLTYAPATRRLTLAREISVELELAPGPGRSVPRYRITASSDELYRSIVEQLVANPGEAAGKLAGVEVVDDVGPEGFLPRYTPSLDGSPVDYVIVTSEQFAPILQEIADWKTAKGVPTVVRTISWIDANYPGGCDTAERIRFFLKDAYTSWGTTYALLGGDTPIIPTRHASTGYYNMNYIPTDLYYSDLDGNWNADGDHRFGEAYVSIASPGDSIDLYPDLFIGRAPITTVVDAETFVDKTLAYERIADSGFTRRFLFLAEVLFPYDWIPGQIISTDGAAMVEPVLALIPPDIHYSRLYQNHWDYPGSIPLTREATIDSLNEGYGFFAHVGHGNKDVMRCSQGNYVTMADVSALLSGVDKTGFGWMLNCSSTAIESDCIAERFITNPIGGASSIFGPTVYCFPTTADAYFYEWFDFLFVYGTSASQGVVSASCKIPFIPGSFYDNTDRVTQLSFVFLGDPEARLWTSRATTMIVSHSPPTVTLGPTDLLVTVSDPAAVEGALVCVVKDGEVYATGTTDASGEAVLSFTPKTTGTMTITTTARDHYPVEDTFGVASTASPHVTLRDHGIDDDSIGWSDGNGNGRAEAGEAIEMDITVGNGGLSAATGVTATLVNGDPYITVIDGTHALGDIPALQEVAFQDAFFVAISDDCPNEHEVYLNLEFTDGSRTTWYDGFLLRVFRPNLVQAHNDVDDGVGGNGIPGVGETIILTIEVLNDGNGTADAVSGILRYPGAAITLTDSLETWGDIEPGDQVAGQTGFEFDVDAPIADLFRLVLTDEDGKEWSYYCDLARPGPLDGLTGTVKSTTISLQWNQSQELDLWGYNIYRTNHPAGTFEVANDGVIEGTAYFADSGLLENTKYYYSVAAIDSSGNVGSRSSILEISTNPPSQTGWPLYGGEANYGTPAAVDIDGDGDLEVLIGSMDVYCWHHNGIEYMDGDGDPRTNGIFTVQGLGGYRSSIAVAEMDGDPTPEFVAAPWGEYPVDTANYRVYAWNGDDGSVLDGWPVTTELFCWATPALGDLNNDGMADVVISCADGNLYAWDSSGQELIDGDQNPETDGVFAYLGWPYGYQYGSPTLVDLDDDPDLEIVVPSRAESVYVFNSDGSRVDGWPVWAGGPCIGSPAAADLDGDGSPEIIVNANDSFMTVFSAGGVALPGWPVAIDIGGDMPPSPAIADFDESTEELEIAQLDEDGLIHVLTWEGDPVAGWPQAVPTDPGASGFVGSSVSVGDVDGDALPDIVVGTNQGRVHAFSADGVELNGYPIQTDDAVYCTPTLADLDLDGDVEVIVAGQDRGIYVWDCEGIFDPIEGAEWATFRHDFARTGNYDRALPVGVPEDGDATPRVLALEQNYPNPFNPTTTIAFAVPDGAGDVEVAVYNLAGRLVRRLASGPFVPGRHLAVWDGTDGSGEAVASGVYFVRLASGERTATRRIVLLK